MKYIISVTLLLSVLGCASRQSGWENKTQAVSLSSSELQSLEKQAQASWGQRADTQKLVDYLLSPSGQTYFAEKTFEYPLVEGVPTAEGLRPLDEVVGPAIDLGQLSDLVATQEMLARVGLI